ncbi:MAG: D-alanyl-D-alanine carboxypeptidase [Deltaproteobacteria bacterium]|nr:D-alanyl-D-alanine carboxypeptidase [Deltaproteobacteria bacterium]
MRNTWGGVAVAVIMLLVPPQSSASSADSPRVTARAALVMDADSGTVIWERNPDLELPPASTTKVMTAILALESNALGRSFPASPEACQAAPSKVNLQPGQRLNLEDLVYAILLNSANDASVVIAESLTGSIPEFADRMNARARQLGAFHSHFMNPHGLTAEGHYSTVHDLATIFRHGVHIPKFRSILGTKSVIVSVENSTRIIALHSHNRLLEGYRIPVIGKTGYTIPAKKCFVGAGTFEGREIIVAVLGSSDLWGDTKRLFEFGFGDALPPAPLLQHAAMRPSLHRATRAGKRAPLRSNARPAGGQGRYAIQVGSFERVDRAKRLQHALGRRGYDAAINRVAKGSGKHKRTEYQVQVGAYPNRGQAESAVRTMAAHVDVPVRIVQR